MMDRILQEPSLCLGLLVWIVAATVLPLQLGLAGGAVLGFVAYLAVAALLFASADALLNPMFYRRLSDVLFQSVFWMIGLAVPAAAMFALGSAFAPAREGLADDLCLISGVIVPPDNSEGPLAEAFDPTEACETAA